MPIRSNQMRRDSDRHKNYQRLLARVIFSSRWLQAPLYVGLILAQCVYVYQFILELIHLLEDLNHIGENQIMLIVLGLIDVVMISNLLVMVIIGGYETFVSRLRVDDHPDIPEWLDHVNANTMKIKLSLALIGISSIHLLKTFMNMENLAAQPEHVKLVLLGQLSIHGMLLLSSLLMAYTVKITATIADETNH